MAHVHTIAVLEDDPLQRGRLLDQVDACVRPLLAGDDAFLREFACAEDLAAYVRAGEPLDILLADIVLDSPSAGKAAADGASLAGDCSAADTSPTAIDAVRRLMLAQRGVQVIYVTGYDQYHTRAYETEHACFLVKPVDDGELAFALRRALDRAARGRMEPLRIRCGFEERIVDPRDIVYIESERRVLNIYTVAEAIRTYGKLADLEGSLPADFVRCHKSFLVNMRYIKVIGQGELRLAQGESVPVSQSRRRQTQEAVRAYARGI